MLDRREFSPVGYKRMTLEKYWGKRDFGKTPEPHGKLAPPHERWSYFIQRHEARSLHYDFRLELEGTLKSWAIPKGPSLDPADKRLAVHVEDHPLDYGGFEGVIPPGEYGAGTVLLWDRGVWIPEGDALEGYRKGHLKFRLDGEKLQGGWALVRMGGAAQKKENWLLIKERDEAAREDGEADITRLRPEGVTQQSRKGRAKATTATTTGRHGGTAEPHRSPPAPADEAPLKGVRPTPMPLQLRPQLATLAAAAPGGEDWLSEVKFDGYRILCRLEHGVASTYTRTGLDWSAKWPTIIRAAQSLPVEQAWLDGEVVALDADGAIDFQSLQNLAQKGTRSRPVYYVFDLVYLNGHDLSGAPLAARKRVLQTLLAHADPGGAMLYSDHVAGSADETFRHACMHGLEGIVLKRADAPYEQTRSRNWLKLKCRQRQEFVIGGYTDPKGAREAFGALLLGVYDRSQRLMYSGRVGTGFDQVQLAALAQRFKKLEQADCPFHNPPGGNTRRGVHWLKPELAAEINFAQWTDTGNIRHASFVSLRSDKPPEEIVHETPLTPGQLARGQQAEAERDDHRVAGIRLSHPAKILFPESGLTKLDLARYYDRIAERILPHLQQRPLVLVRCPHGGGEKCFFQKHVSDAVPEQIERIDVPEEKGRAVYMMANDRAALISLVQMGVLELHTWGSKAGRLDTPDRIIFDLDPAPEQAWQQVIEAAQLVHALLDDIGLRSFVKTTGGKGLHVVAPLQPERKWHEVKAFSRGVAEHLAVTLPERFTAKMSKASRSGKTFIDYLRNDQGATAVAAYSTRARLNAPLSVPLAWDELGPEIRSDSFTLENIDQRLAQLGADPWAGYFEVKQRITQRMLDTFEVE